jgi:cell division protein FtsZ
MSFSIEFADEMVAHQARIKVIGCGGSGGAINTMIHFELEGVRFASRQHGRTGAEPMRLRSRSPRAGGDEGLGRGADRARAEGGLEDVTDSRRPNPGDMVFVTAGMGGGTRAQLRLCAQLARETRADRRRRDQTVHLRGPKAGAARPSRSQVLAEHVDTLIDPRRKLITLADEAHIIDLRKADEVLFQAVRESAPHHSRGHRQRRPQTCEPSCAAWAAPDGYRMRQG